MEQDKTMRGENKDPIIWPCPALLPSLSLSLSLSLSTTLSRMEPISLSLSLNYKHKQKDGLPKPFMAKLDNIT